LSLVGKRKVITTVVVRSLVAMTSEAEYQLSEYELQRLERIRKNEAFLESLGLLNHKAKMMQQTTQKTKRNQKRAAKIIKAKPGEERRSSRLKSSPEEGTKLLMLSYANSDDRVEIAVEQEGGKEVLAGGSPSSTARLKRESGPEAVPPSGSFRTTRRVALENIQDLVLTEEEKEKLATMDSNYLQKFQEFLVYHNKISDQNVRNVMRQVTKLATGHGVRYDSPRYGWKPHQVFQKGVKVTPLSDFVELMELAQQAEDEWGRDHGNGWLLSHPLKKMLLFQQFCLQNPDFLTSKCRLKDYYAMDDDEVGEEGDEIAQDAPNGGDSDKENPTPTERNEPYAKRSAALKAEDEPLQKKSKAPHPHVGSRIAKLFDDGVVYFGTVERYTPHKKWWWIVYDDGDQEELDYQELHACLKLYSQQEKFDE
jgi:hypothetical protein